MKVQVQPTPKKLNLTPTRNGLASFTTVSNPIPKKLKRLPHVFARVLELPFNSDAEVFVHETKACFRFIASCGDITKPDDFQVHVFEILPGVTKIAVRRAQSFHQSLAEDHDIEMWRYRLPMTSFPEMASARCIGGQLVVKVPKTLNVEDVIEDEDNYGKEEEVISCRSSEDSQ